MSLNDFEISDLDEISSGVLVFTKAPEEHDDFLEDETDQEEQDEMEESVSFYVEVPEADYSVILSQLEILHQDLFIIASVLLLIFCRLVFKGLTRR